MPKDTKTSDAVTDARTEHDARILRESLTKCRRDVSIPLRDQEIRNLQKRIDNDRAKPCEHVVKICYDAFTRGAPRADVEAFFRAGIAMVGEWYEANQPVADLPVLLRQVRESEAIAGIAELEMALDPSPKTIADGVDVLRRELVAVERLVATCERYQFADAAPRNRMVA